MAGDQSCVVLRDMPTGNGLLCVQESSTYFLMQTSTPSTTKVPKQLSSHTTYVLHSSHMTDYCMANSRLFLQCNDN